MSSTCLVQGLGNSRFTKRPVLPGLQVIFAPGLLEDELCHLRIGAAAISWSKCVQDSGGLAPVGNDGKGSSA